MANSAFPLGDIPRYVRVQEVRSDGFVEFDFAIGEPEIFVELILPAPAFEEFCSANNVTLLEGADKKPADSDWDWRMRDATQRRFRSLDRPDGPDVHGGVNE